MRCWSKSPSQKTGGIDCRNKGEENQVHTVGNRTDGRCTQNYITKREEIAQCISGMRLRLLSTQYSLTWKRLCLNSKNRYLPSLAVPYQTYIVLDRHDNKDVVRQTQARHCFPRRHNIPRDLTTIFINMKSSAYYSKSHRNQS